MQRPSPQSSLRILLAEKGFPGLDRRKMGLLSLPQSLLEDVLALTLEIPSAPASLLDSEPTVAYIGTDGGDPLKPPIFASSILPLFLTSRQLYAVAAPLVYKQTIFDVESASDLDAFLQAIGPRNRENLRYMSLYLLAGGGANTENIQQWADSLSQLPLAMRGLSIQYPDEPWDPVFQAAVHRFRHLEVLSLPGYAPWDLFYTSQAQSHNAAAAFPSLRQLKVSGTRAERSDDIHIPRAFSQDALPAVSALVFEDINTQALPGAPVSNAKLLPAILRALRPLRMFEWTTVRSTRLDWAERRLFPQSLTDMHLQTLATQHGGSLQHLKLDLAGNLRRQWSISADGIASLLLSLDQVREATVLAPFLHFIPLLRSIDARHGDGLPRSLSFLRLTLAGLKEELEAELENGRLSVLCKRTRLWRVPRLKLRLVIGGTPEFSHHSGRFAKIYRDNQELYPELQDSLTDCIRTCSGDAVVQNETTIRREARRYLSLVDLYDYSPFWGDAREEPWGSFEA
ncbi:uncharacterized protein BJX67DRAFT_320941 [Aspergillus lucknowensis]|uniref:Uncharacterized protein n=1 Tax=Aspergillus lucknowensis TaxID=176173 RepID=A0ABR4LYX0_9EURO